VDALESPAETSHRGRGWLVRLGLLAAMFTSWGVPAAKGLAGTVMNTLTFYIVRFSAPAIGFVLLIAASRPVGVRGLEAISILIAVAIVVGVFLVLRSEALAATVGSTSGRLVRKVRRSVDPDAWAEACLTFRRDISANFRYGFWRSLLAMVGMLAADSPCS
jgi:putative heme transporter